LKVNRITSVKIVLILTLMLILILILMLILILNLGNKWRCVCPALLSGSFSPGSLGPKDRLDVPEKESRFFALDGTRSAMSASPSSLQTASES
jgi:hypothetical protein